MSAEMNVTGATLTASITSARRRMVAPTGTRMILSIIRKQSGARAVPAISVQTILRTEVMTGRTAAGHGAAGRNDEPQPEKEACHRFRAATEYRSLAQQYELRCRAYKTRQQQQRPEPCGINPCGIHLWLAAPQHELRHFRGCATGGNNTPDAKRDE